MKDTLHPPTHACFISTHALTHSLLSMADEKKDLGNQAFKAGKYRKAIDLYTEALSICPLTARTKQALYYRWG